MAYRHRRHLLEEIHLISHILIGLQVQMSIGLKQPALIVFGGGAPLPLIGAQDIAMVDGQAAGGNILVQVQTRAVLDEEVLIVLAAGIE